MLPCAAVCPIVPVDKGAEVPETADAVPCAAVEAKTDDAVDDNAEAADADDDDDEDDVWNRLAQVLLGCGGAAPAGIVLVLVEMADDVVGGLGTITTSWWCCFVVSAAPTELAVTAAGAVVGPVRCGIASTFFDSICGGTTAVCPLLALLTPLMIVPLADAALPLFAALEGRWL